MSARQVALAGTLVLASATTMAQQQPPGCSIANSVPQGAKLYHVGTYEGTSSLGSAIELDDTGHDVKKTDVLVNLPGSLVVLALTAYDPVVWNVAWTPGTRIVGLVVSGYHGQAIVGVPKSIPTYVRTFQMEGRASRLAAPSQCPYLYTYKEDDPEYPRSRATLERITGLSLSRFVAAPKKGIALVGETMPALSGLESSADYRLADFVVSRNRGDYPAGIRGLEELAKEGLVRAASPEDIRRFQASGVKGIIRGLPTYVVLKRITLPASLNGANMVNILVPAEVPMPGGDLAGSSLFRYGQSKCTGPTCR